MHHDFLDRYSRIASPLHALPAETKLGVTLCLLLGTVAIPAAHVAWFGLPATILLVAAATSRIPWRFLLLRLILFEPFVCALAILSLFQPGGLRVFLFVLARSTLCLFTVILLANTTPFAEILRVLRRLRVPALLLTTLALLYRYVFVLVDEAERMRRARASRTFRHSRGQVWRSSAGVVGHLFVRSSERAERIYAAMCARGWKT